MTGHMSAKYLMIASWLLALAFLVFALPRLAFSIENPILLWAFPLSHIFYFAALVFFALVPVSFRFPGKERFFLFPLLAFVLLVNIWLASVFSYDKVLAVSHLAYWYMEPRVAWVITGVFFIFLGFSAAIFFGALFNPRFRIEVKIRSFLFGLGLVIVGVGAGITYLWTSSEKYPLHQFIDIIGFIFILLAALYRPKPRPRRTYDLPERKESQKPASVRDHEPPEFTEWQ